MFLDREKNLRDKKLLKTHRKMKTQTQKLKIIITFEKVLPTSRYLNLNPPGSLSRKSGT